MKIEIAETKPSNKPMTNLVTNSELPTLPYTEFNDVLYQRILFKALDRYFSTAHLEHTHNPFYQREEATELVRLFGKEIFVHHPVEVRNYFRGVNSNVFRQVETLYCSPVGRSIEMVGKIINLNRIKKGLVPIVDEGIWALCLYLDERRLESLRIDIRKSGTWRVMLVPVPGELIFDDITQKELQAVVILETIDQPRVLGFSLQPVTDDASGALKHTLYSALLLKREPNQTGIGGLTWQVPEKIKIADGTLLSKDFEHFCNLIGITIDLNETCGHDRAGLIDTGWGKSMKGRGYVAEHLDLILDNYLYRSFGYGPRREQKDNDARFERLSGYNRDPLWQFPALRNLMPEVASEITTSGIAPYRRLKFRSKILQLFVGERVNIVQAPGWQQTAWIYNLDGEIIDYISR